jgi:hypothetical protein
MKLLHVLFSYYIIYNDFKQTLLNCFLFTDIFNYNFK